MSNFALLLKKAAKSGAQDYQLGRAPLRVLLAEEAEMEGVPPIALGQLPLALPLPLALNLGFTMVQKYSRGTAIKRKKVQQTSHCQTCTFLSAL